MVGVMCGQIKSSPSWVHGDVGRPSLCCHSSHPGLSPAVCVYSPEPDERSNTDDEVAAREVLSLSLEGSLSPSASDGHPSAFAQHDCLQVWLLLA